jgi:hypothetical protein
MEYPRIMSSSTFGGNGKVCLFLHRQSLGSFPELSPLFALLKRVETYDKLSTPRINNAPPAIAGDDQ